MQIRIKLILVVCSILIYVSSLAQDFEGIIKFKKIVHFDTTEYVYSIMGPKMRIDELDDNGKVHGSLILDSDKDEVFAMNHLRKMYVQLESKPSTKDMSNCAVVFTDQRRVILDRACIKWRVTNPDYQSVATFWVIEDKRYPFFNKMLSTIKSKEKMALYFLQVPDNFGYFPIYGEETGYNGVARSKLKTTEILEQKVDGSRFKIPKDYEKFESNL